MFHLLHSAIPKPFKNHWCIWSERKNIRWQCFLQKHIGVENVYGVHNLRWTFEKENISLFEHKTLGPQICRRDLFRCSQRVRIHRFLNEHRLFLQSCFGHILQNIGAWKRYISLSTNKSCGQKSVDRITFAFQKYFQGRKALIVGWNSPFRWMNSPW